MISDEIKEIAMKHYGLDGAVLDLIGDLLLVWENYKYYGSCKWDDVEKRIERLVELLREA